MFFNVYFSLFRMVSCRIIVIFSFLYFIFFIVGLGFWVFWWLAIFLSWFSKNGVVYMLHTIVSKHPKLIILIIKLSYCHSYLAQKAGLVRKAEVINA